MVYRWLNITRNLLYPARCRLCLALGMDGLELCRNCQADLAVIRHSCNFCGRPIPQASNTCGKCLESPPPINRCIALYAYQYPVDMIIQRIKFRNDLPLIKTMGTLLASHIIQQKGTLPDLILPVPLHRKRLFERGYNQSLELARPINSITGIPVKYNICKRILPTEAQSLIPTAKRKKNIQGAFRVEKDIYGAHITIVDDVMTTGGTIYEIAKMLLDAGAKRIDAWVLARSINF